MKRLILAIFSLLILTNYNISKNKRVEKNLREKCENQLELSQIYCVFSDPDTSVFGIKIRNAESTINVLGKQTKLQGDSTYIFYSRNKTQKLGLTVHPGDDYGQVSIFSISYSDNSKQNFRQLNSNEFETEKGIKLGISKSEIIEKLGTCFEVKDSIKNSISLHYRIELPNDSRTKVLKTNNMPVYFANYKLTNNKLENIEFGFEYP